jgi:hypothetical protein
MLKSAGGKRAPSRDGRPTKWRLADFDLYRTHERSAAADEPPAAIRFFRRVNLIRS